MPDRRQLTFLFYPRRPGGRSISVRVDVHMLLFFGGMIVLIGLAGWLYLHQASQVATYSHEIRQLEREKEKLHREMIALRAEVAQAGSLKRVQEMGAQLGYRLPDAQDTGARLRLEYVIPPQPTPTLSLPLGAAPPDALAEPEGFLERLGRQLDEWAQPLEDDDPGQ